MGETQEVEDVVLNGLSGVLSHLFACNFVTIFSDLVTFFFRFFDPLASNWRWFFVSNIFVCWLKKMCPTRAYDYCLEI